MANRAARRVRSQEALRLVKNNPRVVDLILRLGRWSSEEKEGQDEAFTVILGHVLAELQVEHLIKHNPDLSERQKQYLWVFVVNQYPLFPDHKIDRAALDAVIDKVVGTEESDSDGT